MTCRLDEAIVRALDQAVRDGAGDSRSAIVAAAVAEWLERHDEELIVESYRRGMPSPTRSSRLWSGRAS